MGLITSRPILKQCILASTQILALVAIFSQISVAQQWQAIAPMHAFRAAGQAITLLDGRILVAGGNDGSVSLASCEIYDPNSNTWTSTGSMNEPRDWFPIVLLQDGRVFVAGGITGPVSTGLVATTAGCEIYDPSTGQWKEVAQMQEPSESLAAILLPNGEVFINGGLNANNATYLAQSELFDPKTNTIEDLAPMQIAYFDQIAIYDSIHNHILIQGGNYGGSGGVYANTTQIYDVTKNAWSIGIPAQAEHDFLDWALMPDGALVCLGGRISSDRAHDTIEVLPSPYTKWEFAGHLTSPRWHGGAIRVNNDSVLYIGGDNDPASNSNALDSTNWFNYSNNKVTEGPTMLQKRSIFEHALATISTGCADSTAVFVFGGLSSNGQVLNTCEKLVLPSGAVSRHQGSLSRASAASYVGHTDTLPLLVDLSSAINLDSLWPSLTEIQGTYSWDSSVVHFAGYQPPSGWVLNALTNHRNSLDFDIQNTSAGPTHPLELGTALFLPNTTELATSWVTLPVLTLVASGDAIPMCVSENEDNHWAVKVLGVPSSVSTTASSPAEVWPNPFSDELFVRNPSEERASFTLHDVVGREVAHDNIEASITKSVDLTALSPGVYFVYLTGDAGTYEKAIVKQ